jgi:ferric-dicitrate binding protein FerR (iron transport regulator)/TolA-binding protein
MTTHRDAFDSVNSEFAARELGAKLKEAALLSVSSEHLNNEAERLRRTLSQTHSTHRKGSSVGVWLAAAAVLGTVALGGVFAFERLGPTLTVEVQLLRAEKGGAVVHVTENYLAAPLGDTEILRFSDGSRVIVDDGSSIRIRDLKKNGASLLLEKGSAQIQVVHRSNNTDWLVAAGPFSIAVIGTRFDVKYEPATEKLRVDLHEGRVEIKGPKSTSPAVLRSGQRFEASAKVIGWSVTPLIDKPEKAPTTFDVAQAPIEPTNNVQSEVALPQPANPVALAPRAISTRSSSKGREVSQPDKPNDFDVAPIATTLNNERQWSKLVASGEFKQVTREAEALGLMVCLSNCSAVDLRALADAARYTGRLDTAEAALRVLHDKYPTQATTASYLLGVVDEARGRNPSALHWYEEYLSKTSSGGFVAEAKAARLRMLVATGGQASARQAAKEYLEAYPRGAASGLASKVLEGR